MDFGMLSQTTQIVSETITNNSLNTLSQELKEPNANLVLEFEKHLIQNPELSSIKKQDITPITSYFNNEQDIATSDENILQNLSVTPKEYLTEIQNLLSNIATNTITQTELFRLQYLVTVLNVQITQNNSLINNTTQQYEQILKQQG